MAGVGVCRGELMAIMMLAGLLVAGCGGAAPGMTVARATPVPSAGPSSAGSPRDTGTLAPGRKGEGGVSVLAFRGYAEYGGNDPKVNWVSPFEKRTGCQVTLTLVGTAEEMADRLAGHTYDVVSASPDIAGELIADGRAAKLDTSRVSAYDDIPAWLRDLPAVKDGDRVYGVPYLWGFHQVLYDPAKIGRTAAGWDVLFAGPAALWDSPMTIADAALALRGRLRPTNPFELTGEQLDAAMRLLAQSKDDDRGYWSQYVEVVEGFAARRSRAAQALPYHLDVLRRADVPVRAARLPRTTGWADAWMISSDTQRPNCAYQWIDYMTSAQQQRQAAAWAGLAPANLDACTGRAGRMCAAYHVTDRAAIRRIAFAVRPGKDCGNRDGECTDYTEWTKRWRELVK